MHFASAMNAPVTAVYCSTIPEFGFGPLSDIRHIVEIDKPLYCRPCGLHGYAECPEGHFKCALEIKQEQLIKTLPQHLNLQWQLMLYALKFLLKFNSMLTVDS